MILLRKPKCFWNLRILYQSSVRNINNTKGQNSEKLNERQRELMSRSLPKKRKLPGVQDVILVGSGKGGVGKSTTSVNLALALSAVQENLNIGILDADVFGPSIPIMMNIHEEPLVNEENKMIPLTNFGIKCMSMGFLVKPENSVVWRGPMVMGAIEKMLHGTLWNPLDVLIVDLPPGTGDIHLSIAQTLEVSGAVIVSTPQKVALADATKAAKMFQLVGIPIMGFVENMGSFVCTNCNSTSHLFGDGSTRWTSEKGVTFLGSVPLEKEIMTCSDEGVPIILKHPNSKSTQVYTEIAKKLIQQLSSSKMKT